MDLALRGRPVLLVGGTRGIGRETARLLGQEGARVAIVARDATELDATVAEVGRLGGEGVAIRADVTDEPSASRAVDRAIEVLATSTGSARSRGRPLASNNRAVAAGSSGRVAMPYTVSVGKTTRAPRRVAATASTIGMPSRPAGLS